MKQAILIYETDPWHSTKSHSLIGIATTEIKRDKLIRRYLRDELYDKPCKETLRRAMEQIQEIGQTQCLSEECDIEIDTETVELNTICI